MRTIPTFLTISSIAFGSCLLGPHWVRAQEKVELPTPPRIDKVSVTTEVHRGKALEIAAEISDDDGIREATLYYREIGSESFTPVVMTAKPLDMYFATIPGRDVRAPGVEYYIYASDNKKQEFPAFLNRSVPQTDRIDQLALEHLLYKVDIEAPNKRRWTWVALGALTAGVVAALRSNDNNSDSTEPQTATIDISGPVPQ